MTQGALFDLPEPPARKPKRVKAGGSVHYAPWRFKIRRLCDDCTADIHARGPGVAPLPATVRWRRTCDGEHIYLCQKHCTQRQEAGR